MATTVLLVPKSMPTERSWQRGHGDLGGGAVGRTVYTPRLPKAKRKCRKGSFPIGTATPALRTAVDPGAPAAVEAAPYAFSETFDAIHRPAHRRTELNAQEWQVKAAIDLLDARLDGSLHRPLPQGSHRDPGRCAASHPGRAPAIPARAGGPPQDDPRQRPRAGQADRRAGCSSSTAPIPRRGSRTSTCPTSQNAAPRRRSPGRPGLEPLADLLLAEPVARPEGGGRSPSWTQAKDVANAGGGARRRARHPGRALCRKCGALGRFARNLLAARQPHLEGPRRQGDGGRQVLRLFRLRRAAPEASLAPHSRALPRREGRDPRPAHGGGQGQRRTRLCEPLRGPHRDCLRHRRSRPSGRSLASRHRALGLAHEAALLDRARYEDAALAARRGRGREGLRRQPARPAARRARRCSRRPSGSIRASAPA